MKKKTVPQSTEEKRQKVDGVVINPPPGDDLWNYVTFFNVVRPVHFDQKILCLL